MNHVKESIIAMIGKSLLYFFKDAYAMCVGGIVSLIGYLLPVRNIVHLLVAFFVADVIFGFWAAKKIRGERFSVKIIWEHTIPRMLVSIVLITGAFMWDQVYEQELVSTYKMIGWFISGVLLYSIAENGYQITKWSAFTKIGNSLNDKIKNTTGMNLNDKNEVND